MPSSLPQAPKPPKPKTIKPIKPQSSEHMRVTQLKANVGRQKDALMRERENQKRQRDAEHRWRNLGLTEKHAEFSSSDHTPDRLCTNGHMVDLLFACRDICDSLHAKLSPNGPIRFDSIDT